MDIVCTIPARYESSRLPGKPLLKLCGKPMICWTYESASMIKGIRDVVVLTDSEKIADVCKQYSMKYAMTKKTHDTHISRIQEYSEQLYADRYLCVCGDEPLFNPINGEIIIQNIRNFDGVITLMKEIDEPTEAIDCGNIKVETDSNNNVITLSRMPIPYPYKTSKIKYKKTIGVECFTKELLDFFINSKKGYLESVEDITLLRFIENNIPVKCILVDDDSISVDNHRDIEIVNEKLRSRYDINSP